MARRVLTLPPTSRGPAAVLWARSAKQRGAELLELRTDLHGAELDVSTLASELELLVAERGIAPPATWLQHAALIDREVPATAPSSLLSLHAAAPMSPADAEARWQSIAVGDAMVKHVEPLGELGSASRLFETQARLRARYGEARVTVLATGPLALPFRACLAEHNALDYLALSADFCAAVGQRTVGDAVRAAKAAPGSPRLGILGSGIAHVRSPQIHAPPFDRIDLPADTPMGPLLDALVPYYRGLAVTSPFKIVVAKQLGSELDAVNTLVRRGDRWVPANTDVAGARLLLQTLGAKEVCVLGDGGVTAALRRAAAELGVSVAVMRRGEGGQRISVPAVWTWLPGVAIPPQLSFAEVPVAIVAYGPQVRALSVEITRRGGVPLAFGPRWLIAQAREQRALWGGP